MYLAKYCLDIPRIHFQYKKLLVTTAKQIVKEISFPGSSLRKLTGSVIQSIQSNDRSKFQLQSTGSS